MQEKMIVTTISIEPALYKQARVHAQSLPDVRGFSALVRLLLRAELRRVEARKKCKAPAREEE